MFAKNACQPPANDSFYFGRTSTSWQVPTTISVIALSAILLAGCGGNTQPNIEYGGLDQCVTDPKTCNEDDLCRLAIFEEDNVKRWNTENLRWQPYVKEAQSRGLGCGL